MRPYVPYFWSCRLPRDIGNAENVVGVDEDLTGRLRRSFGHRNHSQLASWGCREPKV